MPGDGPLRLFQYFGEGRIENQGMVQEFQQVELGHALDGRQRIRFGKDQFDLLEIAAAELLIKQIHLHCILQLFFR